MKAEIVSTHQLEERTAALDARFMRGGLLQSVPAADYAAVPLDDLRLWCHQRAFYGLVTTELVQWLRDRIGGRTAIELGAGNGALGRALRIPTTDSYQQRNPLIRQLYGTLGQPVIEYGHDVRYMEALDALRHYEPQVAIGCWVTHWVDPNLPPPPGGGNAWGVRERAVIERVDEYIMIGHVEVHRHKPILQLPHEELAPDWLWSRLGQAGNRIWSWRA